MQQTAFPPENHSNDSEEIFIFFLRCKCYKTGKKIKKK